MRIINDVEGPWLSVSEKLLNVGRSTLALLNDTVNGGLGLVLYLAS